MPRITLTVVCVFGFVLTGRANADPPTAVPSPVDFGVVPTGTPSTLRVALAHAGADTIEVSSVAKVGSDCTAYTIAGIPLSHTINGSGTVSPTFTIFGPGTSDFADITFQPPTTQPSFDCTVHLRAPKIIPSFATFELRGASSAAGAPEIVLTPLAIDFGTITIGQQGTAQLTVENIGNATLSYSLASAGTGFSNPNCSPCTLGPSGVAMHTITFAPSTVGGSAGTLTVTSNDANEGSTPISLSGAGVVTGNAGMVRPSTQQLEFGKVPVGITAAQPVSFINDGTAAFELTSASFSNAVFAVSTPMPIVIGAGEAATLDFTCTPAGRSTYQASATIRTTAGNGNVSLSLSCLGAAEITLPASIDLGVTLVGADVELADVIDLHNIGETSTFLVREVRLIDPTSTFAIDIAEGMIDPDGHLLGGVSFAPTAPGPYQAQVEIYLDDDPDVHGTIVLTGHAVDVEIKGGCSTGGEPDAVLAVIIIVGFLVTRRRRGAVFVIATLGFVVPARADDVAMQTYRPTLSVDERLFQVDSAIVAPTSWTLGLALGYARDPLRLELSDCGVECPAGFMEGETSALVRSQALFALGGAVTYRELVEVGLSVPLLFQNGRASSFAPAADGAALGDLGVHVKAVVRRMSAFTIGVSGNATAPTSSADQYVGSDGPTGRLALLAAARFGRLQLAAESGALGRRTSSLASMRQGSELDFGLGGAYDIHPRVILTGEVFGSTGLVARSQSLLQSLVGARLQLIPGVTIGVAGGFSIVPGAGAPSVRGLLSITYALRAQPRKHEPKIEVIPSPTTKLPPDLVNPVDADRDGDSVVDAADRCPTEPEDRDGFEDQDGCPDNDNDHDGVADAADRCPLVAGTVALQGCPDDDADRDGVTDASDRCPKEAETINGIADDDGCPDVGDSLVLVGRGRIDLFDPVRFTSDTSTIEAASANVLGQLALAIRADREIARVQVIVHVRASADRTRDLDVSRRRAAAVIDALTSRGVAAARLEAVGVGSDKPTAIGKPGDPINDRLELVITR